MICCLLTPSLQGREVESTYRNAGDSKEFVVNIPPGIQDGQIMRLRGAGSDGAPGEPAGDLYLKVEIKKSLIQKIKNILQLKH